MQAVKPPLAQALAAVVGPLASHRAKICAEIPPGFPDEIPDPCRGDLARASLLPEQRSAIEVTLRNAKCH
jgi:hypothetical protein